MLKGKNKKKVLVTLCDESHVDMAKALFSSAYFKGGWDGDYLLLAHQVPEEKLQWFKGKGIAVWQCQPLSAPSKIKSRWKPVFLSKLYIFKEEIKKWDNVVYLDADCMVKESIRTLGKVKGFKARKVLQTFGRRNLDSGIKTELRFNTGVLAFSTDIVKQDTFFNLERLIPTVKDEARGGSQIIIMDEIILARYFKDQWKNFSLTYHIIPDQMEEFSIASHHRLKGVVFHHVATFPSSVKPWDKNSYFYLEWKSNFNRADEVDVSNPRKPGKLSSAKILFYNIWAYHFWFMSFFKSKEALLAMDRLAGKTGLLIKRINPNFYHLLKKYLKNAK